MEAVFHDHLQAELEARYAYGPKAARSRFLHRLRIEMMMALFEKYKVGGLNALDLGSGHGVYSVLLGERGNRVLACDPDREGIEGVGSWSQNRGLAATDQLLAVAERIPLRNAEFDVLVCSDVLEHVQDIPRSVAEMERVLKSGGLAFVSMPNKYGFGYFTKLISYYVKNGRRDPDPHTHFTPSRIRGLFPGFTIEEEVSSAILPLPGRLLAVVMSRIWLAAAYLFMDRLLGRTILRGLGTNYFLVLRNSADDGRGLSAG